MNVKQFRDLILLPSLNEMHPDVINDDTAIRLVFETIWHESQGLEYITQVGGPALGICQMEIPTFRWLVDDFLQKHQQIHVKFMLVSPNYPYMKFNELAWNLKLNVVMCRLRYWASSLPLPNNTLEDRANYWFNTYNGSGVEERKQQYIANAKELDKLLL